MPDRRRPRSRPKTTQSPGGPRRERPQAKPPEADDRPDELLADIRRALGAEHPLAFLALVSALLAAADQRRRHPLERLARRQDEVEVTREQLIRSFLDVPCLETSAVLAVVAAMDADDLERVRIARELSRRQDIASLPRWVAGVGDARIEGAQEMVHILGDGDDVLIGLRLPTGEALTVVVYVDHNLGTVAKDGFALPETLDEVVAIMQARVDEPGFSWRELDPKDARARLEEAIEMGERTFPPFESDSWPAARPLVEWAARLAPRGGTGYVRHTWSEEERSALRARFLAAPEALGLDDPESAELVDSVLWFGCEAGPGDPLRWSPPSVELFLTDWAPRKILLGRELLSRLPDVLGAFVRFAHREREIPAVLTAETLDAIDESRAAFADLIRSPHLQGPAALLAQMADFGELDEPDEEPDPEDLLAALDADYKNAFLHHLMRTVGSAEAMAELDDVPLPDEPFEWTGIPDDVRDRVAEVLALVDSCAESLLDVEYRTAFRRLLARAARRDPAVFRHRGRSETAAAAICWMVAKANDLFVPTGGGMAVKDLLAHFGLANQSVSQRAERIARAAGLDTWSVGAELGTPDLLVSSRRRELLRWRNYVGWPAT